MPSRRWNGCGLILVCRSWLEDRKTLRQWNDSRMRALCAGLTHRNLDKNRPLTCLINERRRVESTKRQPRRGPGLLGLGLLTPGGFCANDTSHAVAPSRPCPAEAGHGSTIWQR